MLNTKFDFGKTHHHSLLLRFCIPELLFKEVTKNYISTIRAIRI